jgi:hypothetical protein
MAALITGLSVSWLVRSFLSSTGIALSVPQSIEIVVDDVVEPVAEAAAHERLNVVHVIAIVASLLVTAVLLEILGYQVTMFLFLLFHLRVLGRTRWVPSW